MPGASGRERERLAIPRSGLGMHTAGDFKNPAPTTYHPTLGSNTATFRPKASSSARTQLGFPAIADLSSLSAAVGVAGLGPAATALPPWLTATPTCAGGAAVATCH